MDDIILTILESKGALKEKVLFKKFVNKCTECIDGNKDHNWGLFQTAVMQLKQTHQIMVNKDDEYTLNKVVVKKRKHEDNEEKEVVACSVDVDQSTGSKSWNYPELWKNGEQFWRDESFDPEYLQRNPDRITRIFCGNLNKTVTEEELKSCLPGVTYIKWIVDKLTGEFYGSTFLEMKSPEAAALAVLKDRTKFKGRPLKIYYCPPRPGDQWPPIDKGPSKRPRNNPDGSTDNIPGVGGGGKPRTPKPEGSRKLFAGNLAYEIDDDAIVDFFKDCGTMTGLRWLTHQGSNEFRGCAFVEFSSTEEADRAIERDGHELLGR
ncbi:RNA-binding protein [archaeon]|nr:MAG: RNA-binding protein [archaeon]